MTWNKFVWQFDINLFPHCHTPPQLLLWQWVFFLWVLCFFKSKSSLQLSYLGLFNQYWVHFLIPYGGGAGQVAHTGYPDSNWLFRLWFFVIYFWLGVLLPPFPSSFSIPTGIWPPLPVSFSVLTLSFIYKFSTNIWIRNPSPTLHPGESHQTSTHLPFSGSFINRWFVDIIGWVYFILSCIHW